MARLDAGGRPLQESTPLAGSAKNPHMADDAPVTEPDDEDLALIASVAEKAFQFGVICASPIDPEVFDDPVMHNYYLFFVYGAVLWLGDTLRPAKPLDRRQKLAAMSQAMSFLEPDSKQKTRSFVLMVDKVEDIFAHNTMREGAETVRRLLVDRDKDAPLRFKELLEDPANFPRQIDPESDGVRH